MNKTNNWEILKRKINIDGSDQINNSEHIHFPFMTSSLNDLLYFSINLIDDSNKAIEFNSIEKKEIF